MITKMKISRGVGTKKYYYLMIIHEPVGNKYIFVELERPAAAELMNLSEKKLSKVVDGDRVYEITGIKPQYDSFFHLKNRI